MADLSCLNQAERDTLALLAQGHTAKSIAALTGRTTGAVNERLRDARRKTGVGSSRELARLLARQNRDEQTGVASVEPLMLEEADATNRRRRMLKGLAMTLPIAIAVALVAVVDQQPAAPTPAASPLFTDPAIMARERLASEPRDSAWAIPTEAVLQREYARVEGLDPASLSVRCAATACEVSARFLPGDSVAQNRTMRLLQDRPLFETLGKAGLVNALQSFSSGRKHQGQTFAAFWSRRDPRKPVSAAS